MLCFYVIHKYFMFPPAPSSALSNDDSNLGNDDSTMDSTYSSDNDDRSSTTGMSEGRSKHI